MPGSYDMGPLHLVSPSHPAPAPSADTDMEEEDSVVHVSNKSGDESSEDDQDLFLASKPGPGELGAAGGDSANDGL